MSGNRLADARRQLSRRGHLSIEFTDDAPDDEQPQFGAWLELRASDPAVLDAGLAEVKHPGHPYCLMIPGGQVSTIAPTSRPRRVRGG
jgi:hypothetical protein